MMIKDRYAGCHSTRFPAAISHFEDAVFAVAAHTNGAGDALSEALLIDPALIAALALKGLGALILARAELQDVARHNLQLASAALAQNPEPTPGEVALVKALSLACDGQFLVAASALEAHLNTAPHDLLALKIAQALRFMGGDLPGLLRCTTQVLPDWNDDHVGVGFVYGCHAFGLEEAGQYADAERFGRRAVLIEPRDAWGLHAVSHVHETQGRVDAGVAWLEATRSSWSRCNNFAFHIAWHLSLFYLEAGDYEKALDLYDREVRPASTDDFRDISNASSLLWRLMQHGCDVEHRWEELTNLARHRAADHSLVFASLFHLMSALAGGAKDVAQQILTTLEWSAQQASGDQSQAARRVGVPLARIMMGLADATHAVQPFAASKGAQFDFVRLAQALPCLGGSNAQRDVFVRSLASFAADRGDRQTFERVMDIRRRTRAQDRFALEVTTRLHQVEAASHAKLRVA